MKLIKSQDGFVIVYLKNTAKNPLEIEAPFVIEKIDQTFSIVAKDQIHLIPFTSIEYVEVKL